MPENELWWGKQKEEENKNRNINIKKVQEDARGLRILMKEEPRVE